ncbi:MAG: tyrosine-protein phosphatase [Bacteroidaceae bacterium]|nr:tyrosine-protein phosphatase [Bacteroidaceae bacterium]
MKWRFPLFAVIVGLHVAVVSCDPEEQTLIEYITRHDTIQVRDTIQLNDTIQLRDTVLVADTVLISDTVTVSDTIQVIDVVQVHDTVVVFGDIEECDIENAGTRKYLEEVDYSADTAYTVSYVNDYRKNYGAKDTPLPVKISWTGGTASKIVLSVTSDFIKTYEVKATSSPADIYNLIPDVKYYYKVLDSNEKVLKVGCVRPVGPLRMIKGVADNVRDLGGWKADGGHIAYGKIYRGAKLSSKISSSAKDIFLNQLGISVDMDLRGIKTSESTVGSVITEAEYIKFPVEKNMGRGTGNTQELYQQAIRAVIGYLEKGKVVYFHCAGGADRTGTLAFLIEALLGVSESDLSKDYELTTFDGSNKRLRNYRATEDETHILYELVTYLRRFGYPEVSSINQLVLNWATTRHSESVDPLTMEEIGLLRQYLIVEE